MKCKTYKKISLLLCTALFYSISIDTTQAAIPVKDPGTVAQAIENNVNMILELKEVKKVVNFAGELSTTIGEAVSTFNEFVSKYYAIKDKVNGVLDTAGQITGAADDLLGTNMSEGIENVQDGLNKGTDFIEDKINDVGNIVDTGIDIQNGIIEGLGIVGDLSEGGYIAQTGITSPTGGMGISSEFGGSGSSNGFSVLPNELAEHCNLNAAEIVEPKDKPKVVNCLKQLIAERADNARSIQKKARDVYVKSFHEMAYANIAEAVVMRNYAVNYEKQVLDPMTETLKDAKTVRDDYSGVIVINKEIANMLNKVLMVYSSKVAYDAFKDYGDFEIYPEDILNIGNTGQK